MPTPHPAPAESTDRSSSRRRSPLRSASSSSCTPPRPRTELVQAANALCALACPASKRSSPHLRPAILPTLLSTLFRTPGPPAGECRSPGDPPAPVPKMPLEFASCHPLGSPPAHDQVFLQPKRIRNCHHTSHIARARPYGRTRWGHTSWRRHPYSVQPLLERCALAWPSSLSSGNSIYTPSLSHMASR